jgi:hypothetical protein
MPIGTKGFMRLDYLKKERKKLEREWWLWWGG